jgi:hypothetical protein
VRLGKVIAAVIAPRNATATITQSAAWKAFTPAREQASGHGDRARDVERPPVPPPCTPVVARTARAVT